MRHYQLTFLKPRIHWFSVVAVFTTVLHVDVMRLSIFALLSLPFCLAAVKKQSQDELTDLAILGNGNIEIKNERIFDMLTSSHRNFSSAIHFTAMDKRRKCSPCKWVHRMLELRLDVNMSQGIWSFMEGDCTGLVQGTWDGTQPAFLCNSWLRWCTISIPKSEPERLNCHQCLIRYHRLV